MNPDNMPMLERAIHERLKALAGGKVYGLVAPDKAKAPFVIYNRIDSDRPARHLRGPSGMATAFIQVDAYAAEYYAAKEIGQQIEVLLNGFQGDIAYGDDSPQQYVKIYSSALLNDVDVLDETDKPYLFRNSYQFSITYRQENP